MERPFRQTEFQSKNLGDFRELIDRRVRIPLFEVGQASQRDPSQLRQVALSKAEQLPSRTEHFADLLVRHGKSPAWSSCALSCASGINFSM